MPPKPRLSKSTGKSKLPTLNNQTAPSASNSSAGLSPEVQQQFELELCWCIQQLQTALKSGKLNNKQVEDHTKALNSLMSNSTPLIKKRQIMRLSFGDYRTKMAEENRKHHPGSAKIKIVPTKPSKKSIFIKKSIVNEKGENFKFNFHVPQSEGVLGSEDNLTQDMSEIKIDDLRNQKLIQNNVKTSDNGLGQDKVSFDASGNCFKFNFDIKS